MAQDYKKEVFIFVAGTTPQIITETLYALHKQSPPVHPQEIYIITTKKGKAVVEQALIKEGRLDTFFKEFHIPHVKPSIFVVENMEGETLEDIKSDSDNESVGDFVVNFIKSKAEDDGARLHCSIAGGRKTMSFYLGAALGLFGRPWDKLYHCLVPLNLNPTLNFTGSLIETKSLRLKTGMERL